MIGMLSWRAAIFVVALQAAGLWMVLNRFDDLDLEISTLEDKVSSLESELSEKADGSKLDEVSTTVDEIKSDVGECVGR